jgi:hypothetical protein
MCDALHLTFQKCEVLTILDKNMIVRIKKMNYSNIVLDLVLV